MLSSSAFVLSSSVFVFNSGDCRVDNLCATGCSPFMVGNGNCDANCTSAACNFDGGDCGRFCDAPQNCPISWVNNGACDVACFEADGCENDGRDCNFSPRCSRGCVDYVMLANARCEPACNTTECGYDYGDCGVAVPPHFIAKSCFPVRFLLIFTVLRLFYDCFAADLGLFYTRAMYSTAILSAYGSTRSATVPVTQRVTPPITNPS